MNVVIQPAKAEDEPGFVLFRRSSAGGPASVGLMAKAADGKNVGYALAVLDYPDPGNDNGTELCGFLDEVFVDEGARGLGVGAQLIDGCNAESSPVFNRK